MVSSYHYFFSFYIIISYLNVNIPGRGGGIFSSQGNVSPPVPPALLLARATTEGSVIGGWGGGYSTQRR